MMKKLMGLALLIAVISCNNPTDENYSTTQDFLAKNNVPLQTFTINGSTGGTYTSPQGTIVTIPANAFVTQANVAVTGEVNVEFKDLYKKSDMLLSNMATSTWWGAPLKSGGEFFLKVSYNGSAVQLAPGKKITIEQPAALTGGIDAAQAPFIAVDDSAGFGWDPSITDSVSILANSYLFSLYQFSNPVDSGTWCNSDNMYYFSAFPQTTLTLHSNNDYAEYHPEVYLLFNNLSSMVHVYYSSNNNYIYSYAPADRGCTLVAVGVKDGNLFTSFVPITIGVNQTVSFTLTPSTTSDFKTQLAALN